MNIFVSAYPHDGADGSIEAPFATLQQACDRALPGGTIYLRGGTYLNAEYRNEWDQRKKAAIARITRSGTAEQPITIKPFEDEKVSLRSDVGGLAFVNASHWRIEGLDIGGEAMFMTYDWVKTYWWSDSLSPISGRGISLAGCQGIAIVDCYIHDFPGAGVSNNGGSGIELWRCAIARNAWWSTGGVHGFTNSAPAGSGNIGVYDSLFVSNQSCMISHVFSKGSVNLDIDEGNNLHIQNAAGQFTGVFIADSNILIHGGKAGIGVNGYNRCLIKRNLFYRNCQAVDCGELTVQSASLVDVHDNLFVPTKRPTYLIGDSKLSAYSVFCGEWSPWEPNTLGVGPTTLVIEGLRERASIWGIDIEPCPTVVDENYLNQQRLDILRSWPESQSHLKLIGPDREYAYSDRLS